MNPSRASERSELRQALGSDECVATYISELKRRRPISGIVRHYTVYHTPAQEARAVLDLEMGGKTLTELLYESREDDQK